MVSQCQQGGQVPLGPGLLITHCGPGCWSKPPPCLPAPWEVPRLENRNGGCRREKGTRDTRVSALGRGPGKYSRAQPATPVQPWACCEQIDPLYKVGISLQVPQLHFNFQITKAIKRIMRVCCSFQLRLGSLKEPEWRGRAVWEGGGHWVCWDPGLDLGGQSAPPNLLPWLCPCTW